jgi:glycerol-3-phosphate dehydrogenase subunit B
VTLDLPTLRARNFITPVILSDMMDRADFRAEVVEAVRPHLGQAERIGFPAVLGMEEPLPAKQDLEAKLGRPVFEIAGLPPSVPGIRLFRILRDKIEQSGGYVYDGMRAVAATHENGRVTAVYTEAAARQRRHRYDQFVLATGGILGGGIRANHKGEVCEAVFDLPVTAPASQLEWFKRDFLDREGHPIYRVGLTVNEHFLPVDRNRRPLYDNLFAAGTTLAHCEVIRERSFDGVALVTGYAVGKVVGD